MHFQVGFIFTKYALFPGTLLQGISFQLFSASSTDKYSPFISQTSLTPIAPSKILTPVFPETSSLVPKVPKSLKDAVSSQVTFLLPKILSL